MTAPACRWVSGIALIVAVLAGCAVTPPAPPEPAPVAKPAEPPPPPAPALDPREERQLVRELLRDVEEYYRLLRQKSVEQAAAYALPEQRKRHEDGLWEFVSRYEIETADVLSYELRPQADGVQASVRVVRTLFQKRSVVPERSEVWMLWTRQADRWMLVPQEKK